MSTSSVLASARIYALVAVAAFGTAGCGGSGNGPTGPGVRAFNAIAADPQIIVSSGATVIASNLPYATESGYPRNPYLDLPVGSDTVSVASGVTPLGSVTLNLVTADQVSVIVTPAIQGNLLVLSDNFGQLTDSEARFVNAASTANYPSVDVLLTPTGGVTAPINKIASGSVVPAQPAFPGFLYQTVVSGLNRLQVFVSGQEAGGTPLLDEQINFVAGQRWTFVFTDPSPGQTTPNLIQLQDNQQLSPNN